MDIRRSITVLACTLALLGVTRGAAWAQADQTQLAQRLRSDDVNERNSAFTESLAIPVEDVGPVLASALIELLQTMNTVVSQAIDAGVALDSVEDPDFVAALSRRVAELKNPAAISALAHGFYGGRLASEALAQFGASAIPDLVEVVNGPRNHYDLVDYALKTLTLIVEGRGGLVDIPGAAGRDIATAVTRRLTGRQYFTTVWAAMDLAVVSGDGNLIQIVERLSTDPAEVRARGIMDPEIISMTQERAKRRLGGG